MLIRQKTDKDYTKQFVNGNALTRGIMKFCPKCADGDCLSTKALNFSKTKPVNQFSGDCWVMNGHDCPLKMLKYVIEDMYVARQQGWVGRVKIQNGYYSNPFYEEKPTVHIKIEPEEAQEIYENILKAVELQDAPKCKCGKVRKKGHTYCHDCAKQKQRERDMRKKRKKRRKRKDKGSEN